MISHVDGTTQKAGAGWGSQRFLLGFIMNPAHIPLLSLVSPLGKCKVVPECWNATPPKKWVPNSLYIPTNWCLFNAFEISWCLKSCEPIDQLIALSIPWKILRISINLQCFHVFLKPPRIWGSITGWTACQTCCSLAALEVMRDICLLLLLFIAPLVAALTLQGTLALALLATSREAYQR